MNNITTPEKLTFNKLIEKYKIEIPIIQRDYAQGREGNEELRKSFLESLSNAIIAEKPLVLDFVYGSIKDNIFQPLDGQQRLTTLFLLHWYIANKENKLNDEVKTLLTKFTYETRISSREFGNELINKGIDFDNLLETDYDYKEKSKPKYNEISKTIIDSSWFFLSWKRDPTIKSMLTMLDSINQTFKNTTEVWNKVGNITFHFIVLQNFGLSDDLYIKMNARGKPLTDFENFKAKFEQYLKLIIYKTDENGKEILENGKKIFLKDDWEKNITNETETFSYQIDTVWTDLFWQFHSGENIFDEQILNFFRTMALLNYTLKAENLKSDTFRNNVDLLRDRTKIISFNKYLELGCFDNDYFKTLKSILNKISQKSGLKEFLTEMTYVNEKEIFNGAIKNNLSYPDLVISFAFYKYLSLEENVESNLLTNWLRIIRNLVEGSRVYLFNDAIEFANALRSVNKLLPLRNSIIQYFAETQENSLSGFIGEQVSEEKLKAKLIKQSDEWKNAIIEIENHKYFNGQIGFLLKWSKLNEEYNLDIFKEYAGKSNVIFGENGLNDFDNFLFERALLGTGDYLLSKGKNYSFLINNERDISWKRLLRDDNPKREVLKKLIEEISIETIEVDLKKIIDVFNDAKDWRFHFVKQADMIAACGKQKLVRFNDNNEFDILLLGASTTSGYHKEYYSYSFYVELKNSSELASIKYKDQRSVNDWKYFEYGNKQVAFDSNLEKYVWTINNYWVNKKEVANRGDLILELKSN